MDLIFLYVCTRHTYVHTMIMFESRKLQYEIHETVRAGAIITSPIRQIWYTELRILILYMLYTHTHSHTARMRVR